MDVSDVKVTDEDGLTNRVAGQFVFQPLLQASQRDRLSAFAF